MLKKKIRQIISASQEGQGWIMEPECKQILKEIGISVPRFKAVTDWEEALEAAEDIGYPLVCKVVSPAVIHKSDKGGVIKGVDSRKALKSAFQKLSRINGFSSMLMEETVDGVEMIVGAKNDYQFGPVILVGIGGTGVEIYQDISIRMAPIHARDIESMLGELKAYQLLEGYRGSAVVDLEKLSDLLLSFSNFILELGDAFESIDLNPVLCSKQDCVAADARILLSPNIS